MKNSDGVKSPLTSDKKVLLQDYSDEENFGISSSDSVGKGPLRKTAGSSWSYFILTAYMCGWSALWSCLLVIVVPSQIEAMVGEKQKGTSLGIVVAIGGFNSVIVPPLAGYLSDRTVTRWGRRRPYMVGGALGVFVIMLILPACKSVAMFSFFWFLLQTASNFGSSAFLGLLPDTVPEDDLGNASGIMSVSAAVGQMLGAGAGYLRPSIGLFGVYFLLAVLHVIFMLVTVLWAKETPGLQYASAPNGLEGGDGHDAPGRKTAAVSEFFADILRPFKSHDFRWVYITRLLVQMGIYSVQEFMNYFVGDIIVPGNRKATQTTTSLLLAVIVVAGGLSGFVCGKLSDRFGGKRKMFVYVAGGLMSLATFSLIYALSFGIVVMSAFLFGMGFGSFMAVDMAMVVEALPSPEKAAQDMGVWHTALVVPQMIATPIAGVILDRVKKDIGVHAGYTAVFTLAVIYFSLGTLFVMKLKNIK